MVMTTRFTRFVLIGSFLRKLMTVLAGVVDIGICVLNNFGLSLNSTASFIVTGMVIMLAMAMVMTTRFVLIGSFLRTVLAGVVDIGICVLNNFGLSMNRTASFIVAGVIMLAMTMVMTMVMAMATRFVLIGSFLRKLMAVIAGVVDIGIC